MNMHVTFLLTDCAVTNGEVLRVCLSQNKKVLMSVKNNNITNIILYFQVIVRQRSFMRYLVQAWCMRQQNRAVLETWLTVRVICLDMVNIQWTAGNGVAAVTISNMDCGSVKHLWMLLRCWHMKMEWTLEIPWICIITEPDVL